MRRFLHFISSMGGSLTPSAPSASSSWRCLSCVREATTLVSFCCDKRRTLPCRCTTQQEMKLQAHRQSQPLPRSATGQALCSSSQGPSAAPAWSASRAMQHTSGYERGQKNRAQIKTVRKFTQRKRAPLARILGLCQVLQVLSREAAWALCNGNRCKRCTPH